MVAELYTALRKAGVDEPTARAAAEAVLGAKEGADLVTTPVLRAEIEGLRREMAELKADLIKWNVGAMAVLTAIFAAIVRLA
jgi:hypothetical protein